MSQLIDSQTAGQFDRLPPHSIEAEQCLLASMMLEKEIIGHSISLIERDSFYQVDHQIIFEVLIKLYEQNRPVDVTILREELIKRGLYEEIGGATYLAQLLNTIPSAAHGLHYAGIVREKFLLRQLIAASNEVLREAYAPHEKADIVVDRAEHRIFEIAEKRIGGTITRLDSVLHEVYEMLEDKGRRGIETDFLEFDDMLNGLQNGEMVIVAARPSMGKCLAADSEIVSIDGSVRTIEQIVRDSDASELLSLGQDLKLRRSVPAAFVDDGIKPVFRVTTRLGRAVVTTLTHPFLTLDGWTRLEDLKPGDSIGVPRVLPLFGQQTMPDHEAKLLGYFIGDGGLTQSQPRFTNTSARIGAEFLECVEAIGGVKTRVNDSGGTRAASFAVAVDREALNATRQRFSSALKASLKTMRISGRQTALKLRVSPSLVWQWLHGKSIPDGPMLESLCRLLECTPADLCAAGEIVTRKNARNRLTQFLVMHDLWGKSAAQKHVPEIIFRATRESVALFLNRLFATDGWATLLRSGQAQIGYATVSEKLAHQIQHLLLRFGIIAKLRRRKVKYAGDYRCCWQLDITDSKSIQTFTAEIGIFDKEQALQAISIALGQKRYQTNCDLIPRQIWSRIDQVRGNLRWGQVAEKMGLNPRTNLHVGARALSRHRLARIADALDSGELRAIAQSDVYWDRIVSIEYLGKQQVYDLTIQQTHNFIANDVCVHNTAFAMNVIENVAANHRLPCAVFSLEMSKQQLAQRMLCSRAGIDAQKVRKGQLSAEEFRKLAAVVVELSKAPIWVDDSPGLTILELRAKARRLKRQHDIKLLVIDYMQLMDAPEVDESRQQQISQISRGIKAVARELEIPVIAVSQLNRASENRDGHRPRMSDLRESGSIEQDADVVILLHREDYYKMSDPDFVPDHIAEVIVAKQRNGPTGTVKLTFDNKTTTFRNLAAQIDPF